MKASILTGNLIISIFCGLFFLTGTTPAFSQEKSQETIHEKMVFIENTINTFALEYAAIDGETPEQAKYRQKLLEKRIETEVKVATESQARTSSYVDQGISSSADMPPTAICLQMGELTHQSFIILGITGAHDELKKEESFSRLKNKIRESSVFIQMYCEQGISSEINRIPNLRDVQKRLVVFGRQLDNALKSVQDFFRTGKMQISAESLFEELPKAPIAPFHLQNEAHEGEPSS